MLRKLLVANWKENPQTEAQALELFHAIAKARPGSGVASGARAADVIICPPFIYLEEIARAFRKLPTRSRELAYAKKNFALGAQDVFWEERGAFTSEVGPKMLKSLGVRYVIIGHSERRKYGKETDVTINRKIKLALKDDLHVILCVGEPLAVRRKGIAAAQRYIKNQLKKDFAGIGKNIRGTGARTNITIAYEPIWAIGSGKNDKPEDAVAMARFIKKTIGHQLPGLSGSQGSSTSGPLGIPFLYGGSANSKNIADYVQYKEIDGALVGGASLKAAEFSKMIAIVNKN